MDKLIFPVFLLLFSISLPAQKSQYFNYDKATVNAAMDQISESTAASESFINVLADSVQNKSSSTFGYVILGCAAGFGGTIAGFYGSNCLAESYWLPAMIAGDIVGIVSSTLAVKRTTRDPEKTKSTLIGGIVGPVLVLGAAIILLIR